MSMSFVFVLCNDFWRRLQTRTWGISSVCLQIWSHPSTGDLPVLRAKGKGVAEWEKGSYMIQNHYNYNYRLLNHIKAGFSLHIVESGSEPHSKGHSLYIQTIETTKTKVKKTHWNKCHQNKCSSYKNRCRNHQKIRPLKNMFLYRIYIYIEKQQKTQQNNSFIWRKEKTSLQDTSQVYVKNTFLTLDSEPRAAPRSWAARGSGAWRHQHVAGGNHF